MNDRRPAEAIVAVPARPLGQGEVDLHLGAAEAEPLPRFGNIRRSVGRFQQAYIQLRRGDVADDGAFGSGGAPSLEPHSRGASSLDENSLYVGAGLADSTVILDEANERIDETRTTTARNRHTPGFDRERDHAGHESRRSRIRPEPRMEDPRRQEPVRALRLERGRQPVSAALHDLGAELGETAAPQTAVCLRPEAQPGRRPELGAEDTEHELGLRADARDRFSPGLAVTFSVALELRCVRVGAGREEDAFAVREQRAGRVLCVQVLQSTLRERRPELRVRRTTDPERMPGAEHVVVEARLGELGRAYRPAQLRLTLEHGYAPTGQGEERRTRERVDAAADHDSVVVSHARARGTRRRSRARASSSRAP